MMRRWWPLLYLTMLIVGAALVAPIHAAPRASRAVVNRQLAQELSDHRVYADSDPGNYGYAKYIHQVRVASHRGITVKVSRNFCQLVADDKTSVMNQVQALARMVLVDSHWISKRRATRGLVVTVRHQGRVVGRSRPHDPYHYEW
mgnify:CR=1 FL=1